MRQVDFTTTKAEQTLKTTMYMIYYDYTKIRLNGIVKVFVDAE